MSDSFCALTNFLWLFIQFLSYCISHKICRNLFFFGLLWLFLFYCDCLFFSIIAILGSPKFQGGKYLGTKPFPGSQQKNNKLRIARIIHELYCMYRDQLRWGNPFNNIDLLWSQHGLIITCSVKCEMKLLIHSQTSAVHPWKIGNGLVISYHTALSM